MEETSEIILELGIELSRKVGARAMFLNVDALDEMEPGEEVPEDIDIFFTTKNQELFEKLRAEGRKAVKVPALELGRLDQMKIAVVMALSEGELRRGDRIVCVSGIPKLRTLDTLMVLEIGAELEMLRTAELSDVLEGVDPKIFEATLSLAVELAAEGREGRPAGALFVLGDTDVVMQYSRQLIINPFRGYPEDDRNILDPQLRETVKEFSSLDGAFIIRGDGTIEAAGRHLNAAYDGDELPRGLGSRHAAAAGITSISKAIAIALSESTGTVNVFKGGRVLVKIEKSPSAPKRLPEHHHHV